MSGICFRCNKGAPLNIRGMCGPCMTLWLGLSPEERRTWIHSVKAPTVAIEIVAP